MDLGEYYPCLNVKNLDTSIAFYEKIGFKIIHDHRDHGWVTIKHNNMVVSLFQGHIKENLINFRGGDIKAIAKHAEAEGLELSIPAHKEGDGSWGAELRDPDGNAIYFNTFPDERETYLKEGTLLNT